MIRMAKMIVRVITMRTLSLLSLEAVVSSVVSRDEPAASRDEEGEGDGGGVGGGGDGGADGGGGGSRGGGGNGGGGEGAGTTPTVISHPPTPSTPTFSSVESWAFVEVQRSVLPC